MDERNPNKKTTSSRLVPVKQKYQTRALNTDGPKRSFSSKCLNKNFQHMPLRTSLFSFGLEIQSSGQRSVSSSGSRSTRSFGSGQALESEQDSFLGLEILRTYIVFLGFGFYSKPSFVFLLPLRCAHLFNLQYNCNCPCEMKHTLLRKNTWPNMKNQNENVRNSQMSHGWNKNGSKRAWVVMLEQFFICSSLMTWV